MNDKDTRYNLMKLITMDSLGIVAACGSSTDVQSDLTKLHITHRFGLLDEARQARDGECDGDGGYGKGIDAGGLLGEFKDIVFRALDANDAQVKRALVHSVRAVMMFLLRTKLDPLAFHASSRQKSAQKLVDFRRRQGSKCDPGHQLSA